MTNDYPSPCLVCPRSDKPCAYTKCTRWVTRYRYRQKQINAFAKKIFGSSTLKTSHWVYMHPDEFRRYLASDPCENCPCREWCDDPCPKYLAHFQAKLEHLRKRALSHDQRNHNPISQPSVMR